MATVTTLRKTKTPPVTIGSLIDGMNGLRELRREIAAQDADLKKQYDAAETQLIELLDQQNTSKGAGRTASASVWKRKTTSPACSIAPGRRKASRTRAPSRLVPLVLPRSRTR